MATPDETSETSRKHTEKRKDGVTPCFADLPVGVRYQFEKLKSGVILGTGARRIKSILFSSYNHGEGTTTVAVNFAESLAEDKKYKILMVDANTRTPRLHRIVNGFQPNGNFVFSDVFTKQDEKWTLPKPSAASNLSLVASGDISYHPSQVFDHTRFEKFINSVTELFDFVIFDSSPIGQYYDSIVLGSGVDGVILVVEAEKTQLNEAKWAKQMLQDKNIPILGVVLNRRRFRIPPFIFQRLFR
jgi:capsular exopolysaccharide synthesis family protein